MPIAVVVLAVGMFTIGTTRIRVVGLLPTIGGRLHITAATVDVDGERLGRECQELLR
jgi:predicted MFS family arabinose efflux permease